MKIRNNNTLMHDNLVIDLESNLFKLHESYINIKLAKSRDYYTFFLSQKFETASCHKYWATLRINTFDNHKESFVLAKKSCTESQILAFHFKLIHNILPTNENLKKWRIKESANCDSCDGHENSVHMLWSCEVIKSHLVKILGIIGLPEFNAEIDRLETYIFGSTNLQFNYLMLFIKKYIYDLRTSKIAFNIENFKKELSLRMFSDKIKLSKRKFFLKWKNLEHLWVDYQEFTLCAS